MFCNNVSYDTEKIKNNCSKYCSPNQGTNSPLSYNYLPTQKSQRNPSDLYNQIITGRQSQYPQNKNLTHINQIQAFQLMNEKTRRQNKKVQAFQRNNKICVILSTVLAFSQRIQALKQKLCGYPAQSFSPTQFFNVLDITEKGYVDLYDIKRFVNNDKIREKDIIALFKKVNGDHVKDNARLSYFGFLNLIKPYFNEQLARDLLLRDSSGTRRGNKWKQDSPGSRIDNDFMEPTQESVLLLFQQLILLHCICTTEHEQAKQALMNEYMLNTIQIKKIVGLDQSETLQKNSHSSPQSKNVPSASTSRHKSPLTVLFSFIQNNSQFQIEFHEMKFLLAFLNIHEFSLTNQKYLSLLFMPTNCKKQILQQIKKNKQQNVDLEGAQNYSNTYLTKENLINKGNIQVIRDFLDERSKLNLTQQHMARTQGPSKANFLQFVHPKSIGRVDQNNVINPPYLVQNPYQPQVIGTSQLLNEHPHFQINASNKNLNPNQKVSFVDPSHRQYSNSSSIPQQNIKVIPPRQTLIRQEYEYNSGLNNQFYEEGQRRSQDEESISDLSNTPFLEKFMKNNNNVGKDSKYLKEEKRRINESQENSKIVSSGISNSAFQVVDYGYVPSHSNQRTIHASKNQVSNRNVGQSPRVKKEELDSRYNLVASQYKGNNHLGQQRKKETKNKQSQNNLFQINEQLYPSKNYGNGSVGPKFQQSVKSRKLGNAKPVLDYSKGNYIGSVGLSQSNMINQSKFMNRFYEKGGSILNQFLRK